MTYVCLANTIMSHLVHIHTTYIPAHMYRVLTYLHTCTGFLHTCTHVQGSYIPAHMYRVLARTSQKGGGESSTTEDF